MAQPPVPGVTIADARPLGLVMGGWKPRSTGVAPWRDFPHCALVLTVSGSARYADRRGVEATLSPGDLLTVFPGLEHWFLPERDGGWDEQYLIFSGPSFAPWTGDGLLSPGRPVRALGGVGYWQRRFANVLGDGAARRPHDAIGRMHSLIAEVVHAGGPDGDAATWLARARELIADPVRLSFAAVARRLGSSEQVFRKRFRALSGEPPGAYRERLRLEEACRLLSSASVRDTAERLGFCDQFQFSRRFKARYGIPPREFQRL
jgi:AraC-like DNA-binding protein